MDWLSERQLAGAVLGALTASICVVDHNGTIVAVNETWRRYSNDNGGKALSLAKITWRSADGPPERAPMRHIASDRGSKTCFRGVAKGSKRNILSFTKPAQLVSCPSYPLAQARDDIQCSHQLCGGYLASGYHLPEAAGVRSKGACRN